MMEKQVQKLQVQKKQFSLISLDSITSKNTLPLISFNLESGGNISYGRISKLRFHQIIEHWLDDIAGLE